MSTRTLAFLALTLASLLPAAAQSWDTSGNNLLQGTYYFRQVVWVVNDQYGDVGRAISLFGNISFDGNGNYTVSNAQISDSDYGSQSSFPNQTGTYSIAASGYGYLSSPVSTGDSVYGLVSKGVFIASSTENKNGYNDLFIAAQLATPSPTMASFKGSYTLVQMDMPSGYPEDSRNCTFQMNPDGTGGIGTVRATGYIAGFGNSPITQNLGGVRYSFSNGAAVVYLGGSLSTNNLIAGNKYLYFSADGSFVFGGAPDGFDMIIGVQNASTSPTFDGLYYQAGLYQDESQIAAGYGNLYTYYGALKASAGSLLAHQRLLSVFSNNPTDYMYSDSYTLSSGTYSDSLGQYYFGSGGAIRIGVGNAGSIGVSVAIHAPTFTASGVYIDPTGVVNAGSSALFTSGIAPGELITVYGSNLAPSVAVDSTFPTQLNGVQVSVNNRPAPIYAVSPNQISAVVPFATTELVASVQVTNNGVQSNTVPSWVNLTSPGVFTNPPGGLGYAAALHGDYSVVSPSSPAQPGETISVYLTGLGDVSPAVADGAPGPVNPLSNATNTITVYIGGTQATTSFVGLAPGLVGLYQINVEVPSTVTTGNLTLSISSPDFYSSEAWVPVGTASASGLTPAPQARRPVVMRTVEGRRRQLQHR